MGSHSRGRKAPKRRVDGGNVAPMSSETDLNIVHAEQLVRVTDRGGPRRGAEQGEMDLLRDGAVAIRDGVIVAVGPTDEVLAAHGDAVETIDARGRTVLPGLVECHSHPLFAGDRCNEYAARLSGATLQEIAAAGGGIQKSVLATREASDEVLLGSAARAYGDILRGGVTTLEVKSGYGLTVDRELHALRLLAASRASTPIDLVISFLGAHVVPPEVGDGDRYTDIVLDQMLPAVIAEGHAEYHDVTCEAGLFTPTQVSRMLARSRELGIPTRVHADAWTPSEGWQTATAGGAVCADHLTYTPTAEIRDVGTSDTIAVLLPVAELTYLCDRRAQARAFVECDVPVAIATDYSSSIHATSLLTTIAFAAPWFGLTPGEALVGATLNAAYTLGRGHDRGSLDVGKRGDVLVLDAPHPDEICLALGRPLLDEVVIGGRPVRGLALRQ